MHFSAFVVAALALPCLSAAVSGPAQIVQSDIAAISSHAASFGDVMKQAAGAREVNSAQIQEIKEHMDKLTSALQKGSVDLEKDAQSQGSKSQQTSQGQRGSQLEGQFAQVQRDSQLEGQFAQGQRDSKVQGQQTSSQFNSKMSHAKKISDMNRADKLSGMTHATRSLQLTEGQLTSSKQEWTQDDLRADDILATTGSMSTTLRDAISTVVDKKENIQKQGAQQQVRQGLYGLSKEMDAFTEALVNWAPATQKSQASGMKQEVTTVLHDALNAYARDNKY